MTRDFTSKTINPKLRRSNQRQLGIVIIKSSDKDNLFKIARFQKAYSIRIRNGDEQIERLQLHSNWRGDKEAIDLCKSLCKI